MSELQQHLDDVDSEWNEDLEEQFARLLAAKQLKVRDDCPFAYMTEHDTGDCENPGAATYHHSFREQLRYVLEYDGELAPD